MYVLKKHKTPPEAKSQTERVKWIKCWCGLEHSNRIIPNNYWKKYDDESPPKKEFKYNCGIILRKKNKYFIVQSYNNYYGFPKGSIKNSLETFKECATREFFEETGYKINLENYKYREILLKNENTRMTYVFYVLSVDEDFEIKTRPMDDFEITSYGWISITELKKLKLSKITNKAVLLLSNNHLVR